MPVEDASIVWDEAKSPPRKVATLRILVQHFDTPAVCEFDENLSFTPWHALETHRPLGGINRCRKRVYDAISERGTGPTTFRAASPRSTTCPKTSHAGSDLPGSGRVDLGGRPPRSPTDPGLHITAPGSSSHEFATRAIRCRYVDMVQVTMYLACFPSTAHETAPPSLDGVPRVGSPAATVL